VGTRKYLFRKLLTAVGTLLFVLTFNFFLFRVVGNPVDQLVRNQKLTRAEQQQQLKDYGLDKPPVQQYLYYLKETLTGNLGRSFTTGRPVAEVITENMWPTILLVGIATALSTIFGVLLGIAGAWRRGTRFDTGSMIGAMTFYSAPDFWIGMLLLMVFAAGLGWFPVSGFESYGAGYSGLQKVLDVSRHMVLPVVTLTIGYVAEYSLIMRSSLLDVMNEDYITTARAKGLRDRLVRRRHAVPNALLPVVTIIVLYFAYIVGGAIGVETVFSYPGLGLLTAQAIDQLDYPLLQGVFLLFSFAVIVGNLVADLLYGYLDPRIREA
jgi:peptide/nickel transport system permease protein